MMMFRMRFKGHKPLGVFGEESGHDPRLARDQRDPFAAFGSRPYRMTDFEQENRGGDHEH
jgi:hypothetical protein